MLNISSNEPGNKAGLQHVEQRWGVRTIIRNTLFSKANAFLLLEVVLQLKTGFSLGHG